MGKKLLLVWTVSFLGILINYGSSWAVFDAREYAGSLWVPGQILIEFDDSCGSMIPVKVDGITIFGIPEIDALNKHYGVYAIWDILQGLKLYNLLNPPDLSRTFIFKMSPSVDIIEVCANYSELPGVHWVEPDILRPVNRIPNDPFYENQWALPKIGTPESWDITLGSEEIIIAVIDQGVIWYHLDLINNIWVNPGEDMDGDQWVGWAFPGVPGDPDDINNIDDDQNGFIDDFYGWDFVDVSLPGFPGEDTTIPDNDPSELESHPHGTPVAGLTTATTNNQLGIAGTSWHARVMCLRAGFIGSGGMGYMVPSATVPAIYYAIDNGAKIINMSYGSASQNTAERNALEYAWNNGLVSFAAAGSDQNLHYPAAYPHVLAVAATDQNDHIASFSAYGVWIDICAPGVALMTIYPNGCNYFTGTSAASPLCAGAAGLVWAGFPDQSNEWITQALMDYSFDLYPLNPGYEGLLGSGRVYVSNLFSNFFPHLIIDDDPLVNDSSGNNDGRADPGETVELIITLGNDQYWQDAIDVQTTLSCPGDTNITIVDSSGNYGNIPAGEQVNNASDPFIVTVTSNLEQPYWAHFQMYLTSNNYNLSTVLDFQLQIGRPQVLLVDDDGGELYDTFYQADLTTIDVDFDHWDMDASDPITLDELNRYNYIIWICGDEDSNTLTSEDQSNLADFLEGIDHYLMLVGQNIDEDISGTSFYSDYLHAQHADGAGSIELTGVEGDPISHGTTLILAGDCGGQNGHLSPSKIDPVSGSSVIYTYDSGGNAGIRYDSGIWKTVYLSFALEAACPLGNPPATARWWVISHTLQWFDLPVDVPYENQHSMPISFILEGNYPNPFNPITTIRFDLHRTDHVTLKIYNILGCEVTTLVDARLTAGTYKIPFTATNLSSGIYFYTLTSPTQSQTQKMILLK